jgi:hypothetical protein
MISKSKGASTIDKRYVPEVRPTTNIAYISVEEIIKNQVSFNPNPV